MHFNSASAKWLATLALSLAVIGAPALAAKGGAKPAPAPAPAPAPTPAPAPAQQAITLGFDDFIAAVNGVPMPNGYGGFVWGNRWFGMANPFTGNNYLALGSGGSLLIQRADGTPFYFDGADFWSRRGLDAVGDFYFVLYYQGKTVYNGVTAKKGKRVFTGEPTLLKPDYSGPIDAIAFAFDSNGTDWNHLALDNLRFRVDVK
jgi:hypothetical protein